LALEVNTANYLARKIKHKPTTRREMLNTANDLALDVKKQVLGPRG